jgi:hypothetical protein
MLSIDADAHVIETEKTWDYPEGSDYGHADNASELLALKRLKENGDIDPVVIDKILCTNPARFYGLD